MEDVLTDEGNQIQQGFGKEFSLCADPDSPKGTGRHLLLFNHNVLLIVEIIFLTCLNQLFPQIGPGFPNKYDENLALQFSVLLNLAYQVYHIEQQNSNPSPIQWLRSPQS